MGAPAKNRTGSASCQVRIFAQRKAHGQIPHLRKNGKTVEGCRGRLCEPKMNIHNPHSLWKTPVENTVENVENYDLSTGISVLWFFHTACGKGCMALCINCRGSRVRTCYVTGEETLSGSEYDGKSLQNVKILCQNLSCFATLRKFFVKNTQREQPGIIFPQPGNTASTEKFHRIPVEKNHPG